MNPFEPMMVDNQRLTLAERQRRLIRGLCLYCSASGHMILACPLRPPRPVVSVIQPTVVKKEPLTTCGVLTASDISVSVSVLLDSGSAGNLISESLCRQLKLQTTAAKKVYQAQSVTGKLLCRRNVRYSVGPITLRIGQLHSETIHLLVLEGSTAAVILGRPWLVKHDPILSWKTG